MNTDPISCFFLDLDFGKEWNGIECPIWQQPRPRPPGHTRGTHRSGEGARPSPGTTWGGARSRHRLRNRGGGFAGWGGANKRPRLDRQIDGEMAK